MYKKLRKPLFVATICALVAFLILSIWAAFANQILLTTVASIIESITLFALILQVVLLAEQNRLALDSLRVDDSRKAKEKAVEMARFFQEEILSRCSLISAVYRDLGVDSLIKKVYRKDMNCFDVDEMHKLLPGDTIEKMRNSFREINLKTVYGFIIMDQELEQLFHLEDLPRIASLDNIKDEDIEHLANARIQHAFSTIKSDVLNKLEFFCMYFNYNLADETIVYQSLHQVFLDTIPLMYYDISCINTDPCEKYYTNIVKLFISWRDRNEEKRKQKAQIENDLTYTGQSHLKP